MPLCFDLDGTLGSFGGGYVLLREALGELWGAVPPEAALWACKGSTDWEIVDELSRTLHGRPLDEAAYAAYDAACLARFQATFHAQGRQPVIHQGLVGGLNALAAQGLSVWLVSGNTPQILAFKAQRLGVAPEIPLLGSLPHHDRAGLIRRALASAAGPNLYVGDRPHDREAAVQAGVPFLAVGDAVPGDHPVLEPEAEARELLDQIFRLLEPRPSAD